MGRGLVVADDVFEVFVLVDHACDLVMNDGDVSGEAALGLLACQAIASDLAVGARSGPVALPVTVADCVTRAHALASRWDQATHRGEAAGLAALLAELRVELSGAC